MREARLIAPVSKFVAKTGGREGPSKFCDQKREIAAWRSRDNFL
jgi:hypothetical protein